MSSSVNLEEVFVIPYCIPNWADPRASFDIKL
jgi:hypothetical protein